ncbi:MAG TPA: hypothetical protein VE842_11825, partial [Pyrinomonadaceae bacterium]|nr:hypothetical protein [Pyrinomonadaceae bacterium]
WVIPATPMVLMLLLVAAASLFSHGGRSGGDPYFMAGIGIGGLAVLVGLAMLVTLVILLVKHKTSFAQPRLWLSIALTCLDLAIPIGVFSLILYVLSGMGH